MRRKLVAAVVALVSLAVVATAVAQSLPRRLNLPNGWQPEGIAAGTGNTLYVGSIPTGAVARVDARTGRTRVVVAGRRDRAATVAITTTATHTDHTDHCSGTADTQPGSGGGWVVTNLRISC